MFLEGSVAIGADNGVCVDAVEGTRTLGDARPLRHGAFVIDGAEARALIESPSSNAR